MLLNKCSILLHNFSKIFFKGLFYFYWKGGYTDRRDRKIFRLMIHSPSERNGRCYAGPKPGASSGSLTQVQGPKALGHPGLLSQATSRELDGKQGLPGLELAPTWDPVTFKARTLTAAPSRQARNMVLVMLMLHPACVKYLMS